MVLLDKWSLDKQYVGQIVLLGKLFVGQVVCWTSGRWTNGRWTSGRWTNGGATVNLFPKLSFPPFVGLLGLKNKPQE